MITPIKKTTTPRTSRLGEGAQHRHQQNPLENRTNNREPEDLENPPHRLPPTTRNLRGHHQRRHRTTILPDRVNKPQDTLVSGKYAVSGERVGLEGSHHFRRRQPVPTAAAQTVGVHTRVSIGLLPLPILTY